MKRIGIVGLALVLLFVSVAPVLAGDELAQLTRHRYGFRLTGLVRDIDLEQRTFTVELISYWPRVPVASILVVIQTDDQTKFLKLSPSAGRKVQATLEDLQIGDKVSVMGIYQDGVHLARMVAFGPPAEPPTPHPRPTWIPTRVPTCVPTCIPTVLPTRPPIRPPTATPAPAM